MSTSLRGRLDEAFRGFRPLLRADASVLLLYMWITFIGLSALVGAVCGWIVPGRRTVAWGGAIPWFGVLAWVLYNEYFVPYRGGGASMWPIAQLIAGTAAAVVGMLAAAVARATRVRKQSSARQ